MDEVEGLVDVGLNVKEQLVVLVLGTIAGFAADKLVTKGLTTLIKNRKIQS